MQEPPKTTVRVLWRRFRTHFAEPQHRNAYYLMLNTVTGAAAGLLFWFVLARLANLPPADVGIGYAVVALGTTIGVIAKGGLDTALLRNVPGASREQGRRLLRFAMMLGGLVAILIGAALAYAAGHGQWFEDLGTLGWALVALIGMFLVITWLQDAYFLAEGDARLSFQRNLVFSAARLLLPLPVIFFALPQPVSLVWALALGASALAAVGFTHTIPAREGRTVRTRTFLRSAARNVSGSAAEFLPGLLLAPIVLETAGPAQAAYFGIAWTAASLLFLTSAAISRSTLAHLVRDGHEMHAATVTRGIVQHVWIVVPGAIFGALLAPYVLAIFGPAYAREGAYVLVLLCASTLFISPSYLYLAVLRARERALPLVLFPLAMVTALVLLIPEFAERFGLPGVALAWLGANAPFGIYAAWKLRAEVKEVMHHELAPALSPSPSPE